MAGGDRAAEAIGEGAAGSFERFQVSVLVVGYTVDPAAMHDADPLVGQRSHDCPMTDVFLPLLFPVEWSVQPTR